MKTCAYLKKIEITTIKLAKCLDWTDDMIISKKQEVFLAELDEVTRMEITRYSNRSYQQILENLLNLESLLIEKFCRNYNESILSKSMNAHDVKHNTRDQYFQNKNNKANRKEYFFLRSLT
ncbi:hypothetical protein DMUE_5790 [Dictyocoela muelleri]|nr:hypothetical protein DMUE_5790 [Dictyocoela muelleri]